VSNDVTAAPIAAPVSQSTRNTGLQFNPSRVAYYEMAGWKAYYNRQWLRAFVLMVQLCREQFGMSWLQAFFAAVEVIRASIAFAPLDNNVRKAQRHLADFYSLACRVAGIKTDAYTLAALEIDYWVVHRRLAIARQQNPAADDLTPLVDSLVRLHTALFVADAALIRKSAEYRARAAEAVDRITGRRSTDIPADWHAVEQNLKLAYEAVTLTDH